MSFFFLCFFLCPLRSLLLLLVLGRRSLFLEMPDVEHGRIIIYIWMYVCLGDTWSERGEHRCNTEYQRVERREHLVESSRTRSGENEKHLTVPPYLFDTIRYDAKVGSKDKDGKPTGFVPGGASLHSCMTPHGPDATTFNAATKADLKPFFFGKGLAFMFESRYVCAS